MWAQSEVWDTLIRTTGDPTPTLQQTSRLFGNANVGQIALTNLQVAGQLASDQTYIILALRCWLFFRGTNVGEARASGSGLGLAIARSIVEMHHGSIEVASAPGKGATFTVRLPRQADTGDQGQ